MQFLHDKHSRANGDANVQALVSCMHENKLDAVRIAYNKFSSQNFRHSIPSCKKELQNACHGYATRYLEKATEKEHKTIESALESTASLEHSSSLDNSYIPEENSDETAPPLDTTDLKEAAEALDELRKRKQKEQRLVSACLYAECVQKRITWLKLVEEASRTNYIVAVVANCSKEYDTLLTGYEMLGKLAALLEIPETELGKDSGEKAAHHQNQLTKSGLELTENRKLKMQSESMQLEAVKRLYERQLMREHQDQLLHVQQEERQEGKQATEDEVDEELDQLGYYAYVLGKLNSIL